MASGLEANSSASIREVLNPANANKNTMDNHSNDNKNNSSTNSDYEDDSGEWELAGARSIMKKSNTQTFTQSSTKSSSNRRRRRLNSGSASSVSNQRPIPKSTTTPVLTKSKSNHVELANLVSNSSTSVQVSKLSLI